MTAHTGPRPLRHAVLWSYVNSGGRMAMTTVLTFVLAGMLGPRAFGLIAMALVFVGLVEMLLQQGLMPAIVQRKELRAEHADTAFWCVCAAATALTALLAAAAPLWGALNGAPELTAVVWALAPLVPIQGLVVVQEALLRRDLRFKSLAVRGTSATLVGGAAGLAGAWAGWGVWALVTQQLVTAAAGLVVLWGVSSWRPSWRFDRKAAGELYSYASRSSGATVGLFLGNRADVLLAGLFFGPIVVGLYRLAHRLTGLALEVGARAMQGVALPALSSLQDDRAAFVDRWLRMQQAVAVLTLPLLALLACAAEDLAALLGPSWSEAVPAVRALAAVQAVNALSLLTGPVLQALGRPGRLSVVVWGRSLVLALALVGVGVTLAGESVASQLTGMLAAAALGAVLSGAVSSVVAARLVDLSLLRLARASAPAVAAAAAGGVVVLLAAGTLDGLPVLIRLVTDLALGAAAAAAVLLVLLPGARHSIDRWFAGRRRRPAGSGDPAGSVQVLG